MPNCAAPLSPPELLGSKGSPFFYTASGERKLEKLDYFGDQLVFHSVITVWKLPVEKVLNNHAPSTSLELLVDVGGDWKAVFTR